MALRLKKSVMVHDQERHPGGGPLTVVEKGVYLRDIPEGMLSQLHEDHFEDDGMDADDGDHLRSLNRGHPEPAPEGDDNGGDA